MTSTLLADPMRVLEGVQIDGDVNVPIDGLLENIRSAIRRGHPQIKRQGLQADPVALVCGGPSLNNTIEELRDCVAKGSKIVTVNGSYAWCLAHNFVPTMQIVMDARPDNVAFLDTPLPRCHYALASQCHPSLFDAVDGRPNVWVFHIGVNDEAGAIKTVLDTYYRQQWHGIGGGTTIGTRAIALLRTLGYVRFDMFGMDSCWLDGAHHAYDQPLNNRDQRIAFEASPTGHPEHARVFQCAPWHVQQAQDFLQFVRFQGDHFMLRVHGDGLIAFMLRSWHDVTLRETEE